MKHSAPPPRMAVRFPIATIIVTSLIVVAGLFAKPDGDKPANSDSEITVKGDRIDEPSFEGVIVANEIRIKTDFGTSEIHTRKIKSVSFHEVKDGRVTAVVELDDRSRHQGKLLTEAIRVRIGDRVEVIDPKTLKTLKFKKSVPFSLFAIVLGIVTLSAMEIVLGVDNVIFLAILVGKLPDVKQRAARNIGLGAALGTRLLLLFSLAWLLGLTRPILTLPEMSFLADPEAREISWRDLILLLGGLFLIYKSVRELHDKIGTAGEPESAERKTAKFATVICQIAIIDIVFSLDSVITAVGMVDDVWVMVVAMVAAMMVMLFFAGAISRFVDQNPTIKVLALSFLILIGVLLVAESLGQHIDKGYIYFAMAFAVGIELVNMRLRPKTIALPKSITK